MHSYNNVVTKKLCMCCGILLTLHFTIYICIICKTPPFFVYSLWSATYVVLSNLSDTAGDVSGSDETWIIWFTCKLGLICKLIDLDVTHN